MRRREPAPDRPVGTGAAAIPAIRPQLPPADRILPYLRRIDESRMYSNWGPLATELEHRLCARFRIPDDGVVSASSCTTAITGTILATAGAAAPERPLALVPGFTWVATVAAIERAGYRPHLVDIEPSTWIADAGRLAEHPELERVGVVVPVAAMGRPVPQTPWNEFRRATDVPVVIDGAASFERIEDDPGSFLGPTPVAISFHATKGFSTGEGGCVATTDTELAGSAKRALNFGIRLSRESRAPSTNGKMSEYAAAVGLAELDGWAVKREALAALAERYRGAGRRAGLGEGLIAAPEVGSSCVLFRCADPAEAARAGAALAEEGIGTRLWYERGVQGHAFYANVPRDPLPETETLAPRLLGLPVAPDLSDQAIERVISVLASAVAPPSAVGGGT